jgi:hypothetical protein
MIHSPLSLNNKLLIYKTILKPAWTYGIELWGCASPSNIAKIQRHQSTLLRLLTNAPLFVTNQTLHQDLCIEEVRNVFREKAVAHHKKSIINKKKLNDRNSTASYCMVNCTIGK